MAQRDATADEYTFVLGCVDEMFTSLSMPTQQQFPGHLSDILLFLVAAKLPAPEDPKAAETEKTEAHNAA